MTRISGRKGIRIAVDLTPMLPGGANGGVKPAILELIRALQGFSDPTFSFCLITSASAQEEIEAIISERDEAICLDTVGTRGSLRQDFFQQRQIDLLYAPFGMVRFPACGVPIVSMVVDLLHRDYPSLLPEREKQWRENYFAKMALFADWFQVISDYTGERLAHHYDIPAEKIFRTYLPIQDRLNPKCDVSAAEPRPQSAAADPPWRTAGRAAALQQTSEFGPTTGRELRGNRFFFYPANFWPHKNHELLLIAFQIYRHRAAVAAWDLVLTGGDDPRRRMLEALAVTLGIEDHVIFKGHLPESEFAQLFASASALVFPSLHEGFGIPPLEAMKLGVPVLTSDADGLREVVGDAGLLVDPRKPHHLADAMQRLATSEQLQEDLRKRGVQRVNGFSFEKELTRLAQAFAKAVSSAELPTWNRRMRRRIALLRSDSSALSRKAVGRAYDFLRDRI